MTFGKLQSPYAVGYLLSGLPSDLCKSFPQSANNSSIWGPTFQWSIGSPAAQNEEIGLAIGPHGLSEIRRWPSWKKGFLITILISTEVVVGTIVHYFYGSNNNKCPKNQTAIYGLNQRYSFQYGTQSTCQKRDCDPQKRRRRQFHFWSSIWYSSNGLTFWNWIQRVWLLPSTISAVWFCNTTKVWKCMSEM